MRWVTRTGAAAAALALLAGCGNYSSEDLRFLVALPTRDDLRVAPPAASATVAGAVGDPATCTSGVAQVWLDAKPTSDGLNAGVDFVLSLIDVVRRVTPTAREENGRRWGPFPAERHPGREIQIVMVRSYPYGPDARPVHDYRFEARVKGTPAFDPVILGSFEGASAKRGRGRVVLDFDAMHRVGIQDAGTPHGRMDIEYDRVSDPVTIELGLSQQGFGVEQFAYGYAGYRDGSGRFDFRIRNPSQDLLTITTAYDPAAAGRAAVTYRRFSDGATGSYSQCWRAGACLTYVRDPFNFTCGAAPCSFGTFDPEHCTTVPFVGQFPEPP